MVVSDLEPRSKFVVFLFFFLLSSHFCLNPLLESLDHGKNERKQKS